MYCNRHYLVGQSELTSRSSRPNPASSAEEAVAEDEAAYESSTENFVEVPNELLPAVRELIAKHKGDAS